MQTKQDKQILLDFAKKLKASGQGSLLFFRRAGIFLNDTPTLDDALLLHKTNYVEWCNLLDYIKKNSVANADGEGEQTEQTKQETTAAVEKNTDYKAMGIDLAKDLINKTPDIIRASTGDNKTITYKDERSETNNKNTIIIVSVVIASVLVIAGVIYYNKKK